MLIRSSTATANPTPACPFPYGVTVRPTSLPPLSSSAPPDAFSGTLASYKYKKTRRQSNRHDGESIQEIK